MNDSKVNILIADDHKLFRKGLKALLSDFDCTGEIFEAGNGVELLELLDGKKVAPDLILLDIQMPVMDGVEAHKKIKELYPNQKVIILTMADDEQFIMYFINEGVNGYLLKDSDPDELEMAIVKLLKNDFYFPAGISQLVLRRARNKGLQKKELPEFTSREIEILNLIISEHTTAEIAEKLNLSVRTVEGYRSRLLEKAKVKNIAGLVVYALKNKLVSYE